MRLFQNNRGSFCWTLALIMALVFGVIIAAIYFLGSETVFSYLPINQTTIPFDVAITPKS